MVVITIPDAPPSPQRSQKLSSTKKPAVLVTITADGFVEVFATEGVHVHIAQHLDVPPGAEVVEDELFERRLPRRASDIYRADRAAACHTIARRTLRQEVGRLTRLDLLAELRGIGRDLREAADPIVVVHGVRHA